MKYAELFRWTGEGYSQAHADKMTFGHLICESGPTLYTMELPWLENRIGVSCIPKGLYVFRFRPSKRFVKCYRASDEDTKPRTGILIHPANYVHELRGCIALGSGVDASGEVLSEAGPVEQPHGRGSVRGLGNGRGRGAGDFGRSGQ